MLPGWQGLFRQSEHQVQADVREMGLPGCFNGADGLFGGMDSAKQAKIGCGKRLNADAEPVDACLAQGDQISLVNRTGIDFQGDFGIRQD